jgi:hypothetical protein
MRFIGLPVATFVTLTLTLVTSTSGFQAMAPQRAHGAADEDKDHNDKPGACESQTVDASGQGCAKALVQPPPCQH